MPTDPADLEDREFHVRATELAAVVAYAKGRIDRAAFRRWLRSERWDEDDLDVITALLEHVFTVEEKLAKGRRCRTEPRSRLGG